MFRVPSNAEVPTFDETFKVGFWRWFTSKKAERHEWMTRRNIAARLAAENQRARTKQAIADRQERFEHGMASMQVRAGQLRAELRAARRARRRRY